MLWSHNHGTPPIGNVVDARVGSISSEKYSGPALLLMNLFATEDEWAYADTIFRLVKSGFLRASSVGFRAKRVSYIEDQEERDALGLGRFGIVFEEMELLEHSPTSIPANPGALSQLRAVKSSGMLRPHDVDTLRELSRSEAIKSGSDSRKWKQLDSAWRTAWGYLFPEDKIGEHGDIDIPVPLELASHSPSSKTIACVDGLKSEIESLQADIDEIKTSIDSFSNEIELMKLGRRADQTNKAPSLDAASGTMLTVSSRMEAALRKLKSVNSENEDAEQA